MDLNLINKEKTCCFTGPRPEKLDVSQDFLEDCLSFEIRSLANLGFTSFITGMSRGFDLIAGKVVLSLQDELDIDLICFIPFAEQCRQWNISDQTLYNDILLRARHVLCVSDTFYSTVYFSRNRLMVDYSSSILTYYSGTMGGTKYTLDYAKTRNIKIINLNENFLHSLF